AVSTGTRVRWPPMSRVSSGRDAETWATLVRLPEEDDELGLSGVTAGVADGVTVGNRPLRVGGVMTAPGGTSVTGGTGGRGGKIVSPLPRLVTIVVTVAVAGDRELPLTVTVRLIGSPGCAVFLTWSVTSISVARLAGRVPSLHVFLFTVGHMMNAGAICERALCERVAVTPTVRTVLQTQIEYVTKPPGNVCVLFATSWFVTQRAPARWCLGDGDGLGDLVCEREGEGLGVLDVVGLGLLLVGDGLGLLVSDGLEL